MDSIENLISVLNTVKEHGDIESAAWLESAVDDYMSRQEYQSLDTCLGLTSAGPGKPSPRTTYQKERRNQYLRDALEYIDSDDCNYLRCQTLANKVMHFQVYQYSSWKNNGIPEEAPELSKLIFAALETGQPISQHGRSLERWIYGY